MKSANFSKNMEWSKEYSKPTNPNKIREVFEIPPVRGRKVSEIQEQNVSEKEKQNNETKHKICKPRSYEDWNKFDVEKELEKLELKDGTETTEKTKEQLELDKFIHVAGLSSTQQEHIANLEKMKGNEAYKAQDYEEAVTYYTRSLSAFKSAKTLNNRAQAHIKLKNYLEAIFDCNEVLSMEHNNIKALFRRGIAHKEAQMLDLAIIDFGIILKLDPENKSAAEQLTQIENALFQNKSEKKRKVVIEELESETVYGGEEESTSSTQNEETSKRLVIEEIADNPRQLLDDLCKCHANDDDVRPLSKSMKKTLSIFKNKDGCTKRPKNEQIVVGGTQKQLSQRNSKSVHNDDINTLNTPSKKINSKKDFRDIKVQSDILEESSTRKQNDLESFLKDKSSNSPSKNEDLQSELSTISNSETNHIVHSTKEKVLQAEEHKYEDRCRSKPIILRKVTPFEFEQVWFANKCNSNSKNGASCLLAMKPHELPKVLSNKLDGPLLSGLLMAIKVLFNTGKLTESLEYLKSLLEVPRIKLTALFLSTDEKNDIEELLNMIEKQLGENLDHARKVLSIHFEIIDK